MAPRLGRGQDAQQDLFASGDSVTRLSIVALCFALALVAFGAFVELGGWLVANGEPAIFVPWEQSLFDHSTLVAWLLNWAATLGP